MLRQMLLLVVVGLLTPVASSPAGEPPNVLIVLADDLGFSDLGCYGGEIQTPNLDDLAAGGIRFSQFYNTGRCWPTRASLLTGFYAQQVRRDKLPGIRSGNPGQRPAWARLLPETLRPLGYRTYHSGKWHIDGMPLENGFDRSYYLRDQGRFFNPKVHFEDDQKLPAVEPGTDFYGTVAIADHAVKCLKDHAQNYAAQPFFQYVAFTAPHFPLQGLSEDIARYRETYRPGWEQIRSERWTRIKELGFVDGQLSAVEPTVGPPYHFPEAFEKLGEAEVNRPVPWDSLTVEQQEFQSTKMAIHAAMVDRLDRELGRVLEQIKAMGQWDNTLIVFLSDNGASAEIMVRDDGHDPNAPLGSAATYLCLGPGWSTTSNTPMRRHKTWVHEGGISTPFIVHWPNRISDRGKWCKQPGHAIDVVPTILDILQVEGHGAGADHQPPQRPGQSLLPWLLGKQTVEERALWWSHEGNRALREGDWKLVAAGDKAPWELYDLSVDRTETNDLADSMPKRAEQMAARWQQRQAQMIKIASADLAAKPEVPEQPQK